MRNWLADVFLRISTRLYLASVWFKDRAIDIMARRPWGKRS